MNTRIWFDANNSPHVLILTPIIKELSRRGYKTILTARHYSQTVPLLEKSGLDYAVIGKHGGKSKIRKLFASSFRIIQLLRYIGSKGNVSASFCHGSRELIITSKLLGIPSMVMFDYEYTEHRIKNLFADTLLIPSVIPKDRMKGLGYSINKLKEYPGLKENLYITSDYSSAELAETKKWKDRDEQILIALRPPSTESHYHDATSEQILGQLFTKLDCPGVKTIILPRYSSQIVPLKRRIALRNKGGIFVIPDHVLDGPKLVRIADLCISGGGTMVREAAVLGTPAYSIFTGALGAVDEFLEKAGRLHIVQNVSDINNIQLIKKGEFSVLKSINLASFIVDLFVETFPC